MAGAGLSDIDVPFIPDDGDMPMPLILILSFTTMGAFVDALTVQDPTADMPADVTLTMAVFNPLFL
jgi:hypothetical protein